MSLLREILKTVTQHPEIVALAVVALTLYAARSIFKYRFVSTVASRHLRTRSIAWVATVLIAMNVLMYLLIISVLEGFKEHYMNKLQSVLAHVTVNVGSLADGIESPEEWANEVQKVDPGITGVTVGLESPAMAIFDNARTVGTMRGIDLSRELKYGRLKELIKPASLQDSLKEFGLHEVAGRKLQGCIVGGAWRKAYGLKVGDRVTFLYSAEDEVGEAEPRSNACKIVAFFEGENPYLEQAAYVDREFLADRLNAPHTGKTLFVWMKDPNRPDLNEVRDKIRDRVRELVAVADKSRKNSMARAHLVSVDTWQSQDNSFYEAITRENVMMRFIMGIFLALIAFIIYLIFGRLVAEKVRDIGALRAMGATPSGISGCFLAQGLFIGLLGLAVGLAISGLFIGNVNAIANFLGVDPFPGESFGVNKIPTKTLPYDVLLISVLTVFFALLGAFLPAWRAARLNPVECLRHE